MSYTYLQDRAGEFWEECSLDIPQSVLLRLNLTAEKSSSNGNEMASSPSSPFGTILPPSAGFPGGGESMLSAEASLARTFLQPVRESASPEQGLDSGKSSPESLEKSSLLFVSSRTPLFSEQEDWKSRWKTLPAWGSMRSGELLGRTMPDLTTKETDFGFWPTPTTSDGKHHGKEKYIGNSRAKRLSLGKTAPTEKLTYAYYESGIPMRFFPEISEVMMSWPQGWTDLWPLGTDKFQLWLLSHGKL